MDAVLARGRRSRRSFQKSSSPIRQLRLSSKRLSWWAVVVIAISAIAGYGVAHEGIARITIAGVLGFTAFVLGIRKPNYLLISVMVWLPFLGLIRRVGDEIFGRTTSDPLLLVAPFATAVLTIVALNRHANRLTTQAYAVLTLSGLTALSVFNPLQGGIVVGLSGLIFFLVPTLWFWIGRVLVDEFAIKTLFTVIRSIAVVVALYGLYQTFVGFPFFDERWLMFRRYSSLNVGTTIRPFGTLTSSAEYAAYLGVGLVLVWALGKSIRERLLALPFLVVLGSALFLEAARGNLLLALVAMAVVCAAQLRLGLGSAAILCLTCIVALSFGLQRFPVNQHGDKKIDSLIQHQAQGIAYPLDPNVSSLGQHATLFISGLAEGFRNPIGSGVGEVSIASTRFGRDGGSHESDLPNAAIALGLPGLLTFFYIWTKGLLTAYRRAVGARRALNLGLLAVLFVTSFQWLNGGLYAIAPLPWLLLGWLDRQDVVAGRDASPTTAAPAGI